MMQLCFAFSEFYAERLLQETGASNNARQLTTKQRAVARAVAGVYRRRGVLVPKPCAVCGIEQTPAAPMQMHHFDYSKPLDVVWLCHEHHQAVHRGEIAATGLTVDVNEFCRKRPDLILYFESDAPIQPLDRNE